MIFALRCMILGAALAALANLWVAPPTPILAIVFYVGFVLGTLLAYMGAFIERLMIWFFPP